MKHITHTKQTFFGLPADRHTTRKTACKSGGHFGYVPIPLHLLEGMPASASDLFLPDDSPDRILPTEAGRFRKGIY